jgi:hypothetical protein
MSHGPLAGKSEDEVLADKRLFIAASIVAACGQPPRGRSLDLVIDSMFCF